MKKIYALVNCPDCNDEDTVGFEIDKTSHISNIKKAIHICKKCKKPYVAELTTSTTAISTVKTVDTNFAV